MDTFFPVLFWASIYYAFFLFIVYLGRIIIFVAQGNRRMPGAINPQLETLRQEEPNYYEKLVEEANSEKKEDHWWTILCRIGWFLLAANIIIFIMQPAPVTPGCYWDSDNVGRSYQVCD